MDNLTHSLVGLTLARTPLGRGRSGAAAVFLLSSNAPDIDIVSAAGGAASYLQWHRGPTHGPIGIVGLGLLAAILVWLGLRLRRPSSGGSSLPWLWGAGVIGVACHVLMDLPTAYGTRVLSPFSWTWWSVDWMPIVDVYLLAILTAGLWIGRANPTIRTRAATLALVLTATDYGLRAGSHHIAIEQAPALFGRSWRPPCDPDWSAASMERWPAAGRPARDTGTEPCLVDVAAMPDFVSPFRWRLIAQFTDAYEVRPVDLVDPGRTWAAPAAPLLRHTNHWPPAVAQAATSRVAQVFLGFSRFPVVVALTDATGRATVRWSDLRFFPAFFRVTIEVAPDGRLLGERLGR